VSQRAGYRAYWAGFDQAKKIWLGFTGELEHDALAQAYAAGFLEAQRRASDLIEADAGEEAWLYTKHTVDSMLPHGRFMNEDGNDWTPFGEEDRDG
jgi:hypothetical protein